MNYELLKKEILAGLSPKKVEEEWFVLDTEKIDDAVINEALIKHNNVYIPYIGFPIVLHNPIIMRSNTHLKVDENQIMMQGKDSIACLLRNENVQDGQYKPADTTTRDKNISVEGGIWNIRSKHRCKIDNTGIGFAGCLGSIVLSSVENFSLKNMQVFDSYVAGPKGNDVSSYGIQLSNCKDFVVENINLHDNGRDGVHIDGPAEFGIVRNIRGEKMGDDLVALLAWDWYNSGLTNGNISHIWIDDIKGGQDEFRLLPGQKIYPDGTKVDCNIRNCILENISNLYTVKIYEQHNIENPFLDFDDSSGTVGVVDNICFKNISFLPSLEGFSGAPVNGLFDVCCNLSNCHFENISVSDSYQRCADKEISLIKVGPLTYSFADFGEVFNPDSVGTIDNVSIKNVTFANEKIDDKFKLISTVNKRQDDYRFVSIGKGEGYGTVGTVEVLK
ncbi:MAG: hypothetical protein II998_10170 [Clostridia bacterium]|nr:hypothetical protein [Clostridia bacterium]